MALTAYRIIVDQRLFYALWARMLTSPPCVTYVMRSRVSMHTTHDAPSVMQPPDRASLSLRLSHLSIFSAAGRASGSCSVSVSHPCAEAAWTQIQPGRRPQAVFTLVTRGHFFLTSTSKFNTEPNGGIFDVSTKNDRVTQCENPCRFRGQLHEPCSAHACDGAKSERWRRGPQRLI